MDRYLAIFPNEGKNYSLISEKLEKEFERDSFRDIEKLLKKEKNNLLDIIFDVNQGGAETSEADLDLADLNVIKTGFHRIPTETVCLLEFGDPKESVNENINQVNFIVQFHGTGTRQNFVVSQNTPNSSGYHDCGWDLLSMMSDLMSLAKVNLCPHESAYGQNLLLSFSFAYLLVESHFNGKKIVYDTKSNTLFFEVVNEYIINYKTNKFSKFWVDIYDNLTQSVVLKFSNPTSLYEMYLKYIHCRERIITKKKTILNPIYLGELIFIIHFDNGNVSLCPKVVVLTNKMRYVLEDILSTKFSLNLLFHCLDEFFTILTIPAIFVYSKSYFGIKKVHVRFIQDTKESETKESAEIHDFFKLDLFKTCDLYIDFYIIPFCQSFSSYENCRDFFREKRGIFKPEDVGGLHVRRDCRIIFDFEFEHEIRDDIFIHVLNRESCVM